MAEIICINASQIPFRNWRAGPDFASFLEALNQFSQIFADAWEMPPAQLTAGAAQQPGKWTLTFTDQTPTADFGGIHNDDPSGLPAMYVFVPPMVQANVPMGVIAGHEIAEAMADPGVNLCAIGPRLQIVAYEVCDPVERSTFDVNGLAMTNFVLPGWFHNYRQPKYDYLGQCQTPFEILPGGYASVLTAAGWTPVYAATGEQPMVRPRLRRQLRPVPRI